MHDYREHCSQVIESSLRNLTQKCGKTQRSLEKLIRIWSCEGDFGRYGPVGKWGGGKEVAGRVYPKNEDLDILNQFYSTDTSKSDELISIIYRDCVPEKLLQENFEFLVRLSEDGNDMVSSIGKSLIDRLKQDQGDD